MKLRAICSICFVLIFGLIKAQPRSGNSNQGDDLPIISKSYFIENIQIKTDPQTKLFKGSILIENGLIKEVGKDLNKPLGALKIDGDSLYVYPGFISGFSHAGIPEKKNERGENRPKIKDPGNPTNELAGISPEKTVYSSLSPEDKRISELRKQGFTACHTVPRGRMLPGQGAILLLKGNSKDEVHLMGSSSLYAQFRGARRAYPSTVIGVIAKWKELYRQSEIGQQHEALYAENPSGMERPKYDPAIRALYPVINQQLPVVFKTEKTLSIHRAIALQSALGFKLILANVKQGWTVLDKIKENNYPLFLALELPVDKEKPKKPKGDEKAKKESEIPKEEVKKLKTEEQKSFENRRSYSISEYQMQAANFKKSGVEFGFSTVGAKGKDIRKNIRSMIEKGLSEEAVLTALTSYPAKVLGVDKIMGSLEAGKMANLVISDQPIFDEDTNIRYVFVEGKKYEFEKNGKKEKKKNDEK